MTGLHGSFFFAKIIKGSLRFDASTRPCSLYGCGVLFWIGDIDVVIFTFLFTFLIHYVFFVFLHEGLTYKQKRKTNRHD
ncbi:MAG: hypothetical protein D3921_12005 [Candidatus Electrothrix sp. AW1]|nr:hypothetical protein [Candidatus Electrothrix sp. AX1]MCI5183216.1 hypothetical protein [Candidatus Electrothrix gigas]MCI5225355.1 hypothetical protein [Candidatus Electrothrix gigas]